jgi:nitric oxide reductase large subunit
MFSWPLWPQIGNVQIKRQVAQACFAVSLILMIVSLPITLWEIWISLDALNVHLQGIQEGQKLLPVSLP